jgi:uncharacterized membrane protein
VTDLPPPPPYQPPPYGSPPPGGGSPDAGAALSYGWKKFQENAGPLLLVILIPLVAQGAISIIGQTAIHGVVGRFVFSIVATVVSAVAGLGIYQMVLMITAGQPADIGKAFTYDRWAEWILFSFLFGLATIVLLFACLIPGLFFLAFFGLAPFYFIDGRMGLGESLSASRAAVQSKGLGFPILLSIVVGVLGVIACVLGLFVTEPVAYLAVAFLYRYAAGQPVAA